MRIARSVIESVAEKDNCLNLRINGAWHVLFGDYTEASQVGPACERLGLTGPIEWILISHDCVTLAKGVWNDERHEDLQ